MSLAPDAPRRLPIHVEARAILTDPHLADRVGPTARRLAWFIAMNARGAVVRQAHRPANTTGQPR